jgi:ABC-2 type transport system ATP-binding protein
MMDAIQVAEVSKRFGTVVAVDRVSFTVPAGSTWALLGGNGAGKTTTLSMLLGLLLPSQGSITVLGTDMLRHRYRVLPKMGFTSPYVDLPQRLTVMQNLAVYARLYGIPKRWGRIQQLAEELELGDFLHRPYGSLSAGQRTRISLAKSFLNEPEVLIMDEPTASLDPESARQIRAYLKNYQQRTGATVLLASHNMQEVERMCNGVLVMKAGQIVERGPPADLVKKYGRYSLEQVFLDIAHRPPEP